MFEYKVIPAPKKGLKAKGIKTPEDRFSHALEELMNSEAQAGWEFVRAETLPSEERSGFRSTTVVYRSVLVFRKAILLAEERAPEPAPVPTPPAVMTEEPELEGADETLLEEPSDELDQDNSSAKA